MRQTAKLLVPGITCFAVLLIANIGARCLPILLLASLLLYRPWVIPVVGISAIAVVALLYWRQHWLSGVSVLCAAPLVFVLGNFPHPVDSPVGWAANVVRVLYYHSDLQRSYLRAQKDGQASPVGQVYTDGFGSQTVGLAYDPSGEIALPPDQRSRAWNDGPGETELGNDGFEAHHILGPYYQWYHP